MTMKRIAALALAALLALLAAGAMAAATEPTVYDKNGVELSGLYDSSKKRLTISAPGTYTIKDWYGATSRVPAEGQIHISKSIKDVVVLNLENVRLTSNGQTVITNMIDGDLFNPPEKLHLTVNFDGNSSLESKVGEGDCIDILAEKDGKVILGGSGPKIHAHGGRAVSVVAKRGGTASVEVTGDGADLIGKDAVLYVWAAGEGKGKVTVSGKDASISGTESSEAIFCSGEVGAEVEISGGNAKISCVKSVGVHCRVRTQEGQAVVSVSGDGVEIAGDFYGIWAGNNMNQAVGRIVLSAAAVISSELGHAVDAGSLTVEGCALYASENNSQLLGDASSGDLITAAQGKAYLRTARVHPGGVGDVEGEPQPEETDAAASLPRTGDSSSLALWALLLALSALALTRARCRA